MIRPPDLNYLPYQAEGIAWLKDRPYSLLADEMGLGKTVQVCGLINQIPDCVRCLIVCPASLKTNWKRELEKWSPLGEYGIASGKVWPDTLSVIINYDILKKHHDVIRSRTWDVLCVDEAHYCKNIKSQRTQQVLGSRSVAPIQAKRKVLLTGTPIVNRPIELYPLLRYLAPHDWPDYDAYGMRYCGGAGKVLVQSFGQHHGDWQVFCMQKGIEAKPTPELAVWDEFKEKYNPFSARVKRLPDYTGASHLDELHEKVQPIMLRRKKADVLKDLPPKFRQVVELDGNAHTRRLLRKEQSLATKLFGDDPADRLTEKEHQGVILGLKEGDAAGDLWGELSTIRRELAMLKLPLVVEHLKELIDSVGKVVCFCHHRDFVDGLADAFAGDEVTVCGGLSPEVKQKAVDIFQTQDRPLFIGTKAAAEGLTLTAASHVVLAEQFWVPGLVSQMEDRCHRIGQTDVVTCQHLVLAESLDVAIAKSIVRKQKVIERAVDGRKEK